MEDNYNEIVDKLIKNGAKNIKKSSVILNNDKPMFKKTDFNVIEGEPVYFELDEHGRSSGAIAILSKNTIPLVIKKNLEYPDPFGWTKNLENKDVFERCHIIAYSLSAKLADRKNIFIGTNTLNTSIMFKIENRIKKYIKENEVRILYRVTIKYKGIDQIPTGILIEAQSLDDNFSVCEFCYNVQKGVKFNYKDGTIIEDTRFNIIKKVKNVISKKSNSKPKKKDEEHTNNYIIDREKMKFHLKDINCNEVDTIKSKFKNETTATRSELESVELTACMCCSNPVCIKK